MTIWDSYQLPDHATRIDHVTLLVWKLWRATIRPTLGLAFRVAATLAAALVITLFVAETIPSGVWAVAAACVVLSSAVAALTMRPQRPGTQHPGRSRAAAVLIALPVALVLIATGSIVAGLLSAFVIVPVANYGLPALLILAAGAAAVSTLVARWRTREAGRYPHRSADPEP